MRPTHAGAPPGTQGLIDAGTRALNENRLDQAISYLCGAARASPTNGHVWMMLGIAYFRRGMVNEAITTLVTATRLHPSSANIRYYLGQAYEKSGNATEAEQQYGYALQIDPMYHEAGQALARIAPAAPGQPPGPQPEAERTAAVMAGMQAQSKQRQESSTRLRRGLIAAGMCLCVIMALAVVSVPLLIRSCRGSPKEVVCQYMEAKYIRQDEEAARRLTMEGSMPHDAFAESADVLAEETMPVTAVESYTVGEATIKGDHAQVPVDLSYVDAEGQTGQQTIYFVAIARGPVWRVSLVQSMVGSSGDGPPPDLPESGDGHDGAGDCILGSGGG